MMQKNEEKRYHRLREQGYSMDKAERIADLAKLHRIRKGISKYEYWTKAELTKKAEDLGIKARNLMNKRELIRAIENAEG